MRILRLTAENVKKLKVVDITPAGPVVQVTSKKNGQGKTSVLDSIWWLLTSAKNVQAVPIRRGAEEARIRGVLGDTAAELIVERKFLASGTTTLTVRDARGAEPGTPDKKLPKWGDPREILDALIGDLSFDPLQFAREKPAEKYEHLKAIAKPDADIDALQSQNDADFKQRTDVNRDAKAKRAQAAALTVAPDLPDAPVDEADLLNRLESAAEHNSEIEKRKARREQAQRDANGKKDEGVRLRTESAATRTRAANRIAELQREMEKVRSESEALASEIDERASAALNAAGELERKIDAAPALPAPIDLAAIRQKINSAKATNEALKERDRKRALQNEAAALERESAELTQRMDERNARRQKAIAEAKMPVDGLGFGDGFVTYLGLPFEQASDAEQLRVSAEIAMNENPKLRVIRIRDGSLLDEDNLATLARLAGERDYQIWIEQVDKSGQVGIVLEDGEVVADHQREA